MDLCATSDSVSCGVDERQGEGLGQRHHRRPFPDSAVPQGNQRVVTVRHFRSLSSHQLVTDKLPKYIAVLKHLLHCDDTDRYI